MTAKGRSGALASIFAHLFSHLREAIEVMETVEKSRRRHSDSAGGLGGHTAPRSKKPAEVGARGVRAVKL